MRTMLVGVSAAALLMPCVALAAQKLAPKEIQTEFFDGKPFTAATTTGNKFTMTFAADGKVIREIVGFGAGLVGRLLMVDSRAMRFETLNYAWDPTNPLSGDNPTITSLSSRPSEQRA